MTPFLEVIRTHELNTGVKVVECGPVWPQFVRIEIGSPECAAGFHLTFAGETVVFWTEAEMRALCLPQETP